MKASPVKKEIEIYTDGAGSGPDGKGASFAWLNISTHEKHVESIPGLTNNQAEYRAVISALKPVQKGSMVKIMTDSLLVVSQLRGEWRIRDSKLETLASEVKTIVEQRQLTATFLWVRRSENLAGKLL
jgi:ribonuclease HI